MHAMVRSGLFFMDEVHLHLGGGAVVDPMQWTMVGLSFPIK